jgi:hypothetical protein
MTVKQLIKRLEVIDEELEVRLITELDRKGEHIQVEDSVVDIATTSRNCMLIGYGFDAKDPT